MGENVGTLRKCVIDGVSYDVFADTNITFNRSAYEVEGQATTGKTFYKRTKRVRTAESIGLATTPAKMEELASKANSLADKTLAFELADGSNYKATGQINFENYESESGKSTVQFIPSGDWTPFLA